MSDLGDRAHETEELLRRVDLQRHFNRPAVTESDGICRDCDGAIEPARLAALPTAARCISCQQDADRRAKTQLHRGKRPTR